MMKPLVKLPSKKHYRRHVENLYCTGNIFTFDGIQVFFKKTDFDHCFYESKNFPDDTFSRDRYERINWIKETLEDPKADLRCGWDRKKKIIDCNRRVAIVNKDYVVIIAISTKKDGTLKANFITAYVADDSISQILKMPKWKP